MGRMGLSDHEEEASREKAVAVARTTLELRRLLAMGGAFDRKAAWQALQDGYCPDCGIALPPNGLCYCENDE